MYELMVIGTVDGASGLFAKVEKFLKEAGATNVKTEKLGKKTLAYPIRKQAEAEYFLFYFESDPSSILDLAGKLKFERETLLRHLLLSKKAKDIIVPREEPKEKPRAEGSKAKVTVKTTVKIVAKKAEKAKSAKAPVKKTAKKEKKK